MVNFVRCYIPTGNRQLERYSNMINCVLCPETWCSLDRDHDGRLGDLEKSAKRSKGDTRHARHDTFFPDSFHSRM